MRFLRLVLSDLHLGTGIRRGELNTMEDFYHDDRFAELLEYYDRRAGDTAELEIILNGDIFDLLKVKVDGVWPVEVTPEIAAQKLRACLDGHPRFVRALRDLLSKPRRKITYLPGNHDLDMWLEAPQQLFRSYVAPDKEDRVQFITSSDTYYLPEGIQIRHGHQFEKIHSVDYDRMTRQRPDGKVILNLPWGSLWILEVMNPAKAERNYVDRILPLNRFLLGALLFDTGFALRFLYRTIRYFLKHRVFALRAWTERIRKLPQLVREEIFALRSYDDEAVQALRRTRGIHTLIVGHSHGPRFRNIDGNKLLVNTGTWMRMVNLDIRYLGQDSGLTYALVEYGDTGRPTTSLMRWHGKRAAAEMIPYAD